MKLENTIVFYWTKEFSKRLKKTIDIYWTNEFLNNVFKKRKFFYWFFWIKRFYIANHFAEQTILLNNIYWTSDFTEQSFSEKTNKIDTNKRYFWEWTKSSFLNDWKKHEQNGSFTNDERTKWKKVKHAHL